MKLNFSMNNRQPERGALSQQVDSNIQTLVTLPTDLLLELFDLLTFHNLLNFLSTSRRLRFIAMAWVMRKFRAAGILSFEASGDLSGEDETAFKASLASITDLSIFFPVAFREDHFFDGRIFFNGAYDKFKFLQILLVNLPNLSSFTSRVEMVTSRPACTPTWHNGELFKSFWRAKLRQEPTVIVDRSGRPVLLKSAYEWDDNLTSPSGCMANASLLDRTSVRAKIKISTTTRRIISKCKHTMKRPIVSDTWGMKPSLEEYAVDCPSLLVRRVVSSPTNFTIFLPERERLKTLHIHSGDISFIDWSRLLPTLTFPTLSALHIHHKGYGLTSASLHDFLTRHSSISELVIMTEDTSLINAKAFKDCLPNLETLAAPVRSLIGVLRGVKTLRELRQVKITNYHVKRLTFHHRHGPLDFSALSTALDLLSSTPIHYLGIGLPGGRSSKAWLTELCPQQPQSSYSATGWFKDLKSIYFWPYDCRLFDIECSESDWFGQFEKRTLPNIDMTIIHPGHPKDTVPLEVCCVESGATFIC